MGRSGTPEVVLENTGPGITWSLSLGYARFLISFLFIYVFIYLFIYLFIRLFV